MGSRYALVIGNAAYTNVGKLNNPVNDANDMTTAGQNYLIPVDAAIASENLLRERRSGNTLVEQARRRRTLVGVLSMVLVGIAAIVEVRHIL
jgi:hypothetical protein